LVLDKIGQENFSNLHGIAGSINTRSQIFHRAQDAEIDVDHKYFSHIIMLVIG